MPSQGKNPSTNQASKPSGLDTFKETEDNSAIKDPVLQGIVDQPWQPARATTSTTAAKLLRASRMPFRRRSSARANGSARSSAISSASRR
ncbi:hypothetical protein BOSEA31B_20152 [Hyphomicrobiales bacterium]|nr:hypothetical protein BOSEA31B_20152 [Hyphomicrobiales bacterium]CAH1702476.1 hypothetical protein BOSEA1005_30348 [Hyphomicrobiales bacterium]CAI0346677.1 hypothetical protein BO1005MUT1_520189 [Hyphomicrobiales bacterium]